MTADFQESSIRLALVMITTKQKEILRRVSNGESLVLDGSSAYIGRQRTTSVPIGGLLRYCAIKIESEPKDGCEYYQITETGKEILKRLEDAGR